MTPTVRKFGITAHVALSVGWLGATAAFLVLAVAALTSHNPETVRGTFLSMNLISRFIVIPLCFAAVVTGLIQALGTPWGLFRYYWTLLKFGLAIFATFALLVHQSVVMGVAAKRVSGAAAPSLLGVELIPLKVELVRAPGLSILLLLTATALGVYKPWGLTRYGRRKQQERSNVRQQFAGGTPRGLKIFLSIIALLALVFLLLHLTGHGFGGHH